MRKVPLTPYKLRCVVKGRDGDYNFLEVGRVYTVVEHWEHGLVALREIPDVLYGLWRFERVTDETGR